MKPSVSCKMAKQERTIVREVSTCTVAFVGLNLFVDLFGVVDVGSNSTTPAAAWTLAMLAIVVCCPGPSAGSYKAESRLTLILMSKLARVYGLFFNKVRRAIKRCFVRLTAGTIRDF